jgi:tRNA-specific 2-thiouridylase
MRVLAAMSGGVDSSVAAALMVEEGHEVIGVTLKLWRGPDGESPTAGCCTVEDAEDARRVAAQLGIPYYVLDYTKGFGEGVISRFIDDYRHGRTPNPCIECNRTVKFSQLLGQARDFGCQCLVTGHYARVSHHGGRHRLFRGADHDKDQSYVLSMLGQSALAMVDLPVGSLHKQETRHRAAELGLRTANKRDSQDICFVGRGGYREFLSRHGTGPAVPGPIVDMSGAEVGEHSGIGGFTVGQRRGTGVALGERRYVVELVPETATVVLGRHEDLAVTALAVRHIDWVAGRQPPDPAVLVQYRAHGRAVPGRLAGSGEILFDRPQHGVAPGQTAAFYRDDEVLGGGIISSTSRA